MMYANPFTKYIGHELYRERTAYLFIIRRFWSNLFYIIISKHLLVYSTANELYCTPMLCALSYEIDLTNEDILQ